MRALGAIVIVHEVWFLPPGQERPSVLILAGTLVAGAQLVKGQQG